MDLNGDGHGDILSGSYSRMEQPMAGLFQVLWGQADGKFKKAATLEGTDGKPLIIPISGQDHQTENICTRPTAVDWDGDGDLDLVVGNFAGTFYLFQGEGQGKFQPKGEVISTDKGSAETAGKNNSAISEFLRKFSLISKDENGNPTLNVVVNSVAGSPLKIDGLHSDPVVIDWDQDGDLDLLSGSSHGGVQWSENAAGPGKPPALRPFKTLIEKGPPRAYGELLKETDLTGPAGSTRLWVDDVNSDGKLDLLVGDTVTLISLPAGVTKEEFEKRQAKWQKELQAVVSELNSGKKDRTKEVEILDRYQKLYDQREQFMLEERTGFVWLYLQK